MIKEWLGSGHQIHIDWHGRLTRTFHRCHRTPLKPWLDQGLGQRRTSLSLTEEGGRERKWQRKQGNESRRSFQKVSRSLLPLLPIFPLLSSAFSDPVSVKQITEKSQSGSKLPLIVKMHVKIWWTCWMLWLFIELFCKASFDESRILVFWYLSLNSMNLFEFLRIV